MRTIRYYYDIPNSFYVWPVDKDGNQLKDASGKLIFGAREELNILESDYKKVLKAIKDVKELLDGNPNEEVETVRYRQVLLDLFNFIEE